MRTHYYGVEEASEDESKDTTTVTVPEIDIRFSEHALQILHESVDPLRQSNSFGADIFVQTVSVVFHLMCNNNMSE